MHTTYMKEPEPYRLLKADNIGFYAHYHQQVEIAYCTAGEIQMRIDGMLYTLYAGDAALIFPNRRHGYQPPQPGVSSSVYLLLFEPSHTESFYAE